MIRTTAEFAFAPLPPAPKVITTMSFSPKFFMENPSVIELIIKTFKTHISDQKINVESPKYQVVISLLEEQ